MIETIQKHFQSYLLDSQFTEEESSILHHIATTGSVPPSKGLSIYFNAYRLRLIEILQGDYPKLLKIMKENRFNAVAIDYIEQLPSKYFSVRYFGKGFAEFLKTHPLSCNKHYLSEMATFEWALGGALDAMDSPVVSLETLKNVSAPKWADMKFCFHPSYQMIKLYWNIPQVWQAIENESESVSMSKDALKFRKKSNPLSWIMVRSNLQTAFRSSQIDEAYALEMANNNYSFGEICENLSERMPEDKVPTFALACLQSWLKEGLISKLYLD